MANRLRERSEELMNTDLRSLESQYIRLYVGGVRVDGYFTSAELKLLADTLDKLTKEFEPEKEEQA